MLINDFIQELIDYRNIHGNVKLYSEKTDGRSTWHSPIVTEIILRKDNSHIKRHFIKLDAGY